MGAEALNGGSIVACSSKSRVRPIRRRILNDDEEEEVTGESRCWIRFRFFGSCMSARSKVEERSISSCSSQSGKND